MRAAASQGPPQHFEIPATTARSERAASGSLLHHYTTTANQVGASRKRLAPPPQHNKTTETRSPSKAPHPATTPPWEESAPPKNKNEFPFSPHASPSFAGGSTCSVGLVNKLLLWLLPVSWVVRACYQAPRSSSNTTLLDRRPPRGSSFRKWLF